MVEPPASTVARGVMALPVKRVAVIGTTGVGKTVLASRLARRLNCPHVELDALFWEANWTPAEPQVFRERLIKTLAGDSWVVDGNYTGKARDIVWPRADTLVWLDYAFFVIMARLIKRTFKRAARRELLWGKNHEHLRTHFFTRESLFLWFLQTYGKHRKQFPELYRLPEYAHLRIVRLRSPRAADEWLNCTEGSLAI